MGEHTISPELAQVAAILQRLIEHQEGKILAALVLQEPVRLPLEHRVHGEALSVSFDARASKCGKIWRGRREEGRVSLKRVASLFDEGRYL